MRTGYKLWLLTLAMSSLSGGIVTAADLPVPIERVKFELDLGNLKAADVRRGISDDAELVFEGVPYPFKLDVQARELNPERNERAFLSGRLQQPVPIPASRIGECRLRIKPKNCKLCELDPIFLSQTDGVPTIVGFFRPEPCWFADITSSPASLLPIEAEFVISLDCIKRPHTVKATPEYGYFSTPALRNGASINVTVIYPSNGYLLEASVNDLTIKSFAATDRIMTNRPLILLQQQGDTGRADRAVRKTEKKPKTVTLIIIKP